ncbi:MAG TPA: sigma-54 dependent transcriptional regulator [Vicinamibacterales bacterium]|nr:sigma-54 dependent transcriptional regulator [Vicinamibacterales bacterium]
MASILVIDDEPRLREAIALSLGRGGHTVEVAESGETGERLFVNGSFDVVVLDVRLPGIDGIETLERLRRHDPGVVTVFLTAYGSIKSAVAAMRAGGFDYLTKPFDNDELLLAIDRAVERHQLGRRVQALELEVEGRTAFPDIIGRSEAIRRALVLLARVAPTDTAVLLLGESGTGKELAARGVHRYSRRADRPFVALNCGAIAGTLAESELFGHERGAFTDARERRLGHFESTRGGTLFLDEVGELSLEVQAKLLRVLEEGKIQRLGSSEPTSIDVRIVAATNRDIEADVAAKRFRADLYWRLNQFPIRMPPLRDRLEDLPLLVNHLISKLNAALGTEVAGASPGVLERLRNHGWPGNVRELENVIRWAMLVAEEPIVTERELPPHALGAAAGGNAGEPQAAPLAEMLKRSRERTERAAIEAAMAAHQGRRTDVAAALGISRRALFNKLKEYGLEDRGSD